MHRFVVCQQIQVREFGTSDKIRDYIHYLFDYYDIFLHKAILIGEKVQNANLCLSENDVDSRQGSRYNKHIKSTDAHKSTYMTVQHTECMRKGERTMKKRLLAALMTATMAMSLAACGGGDTAPAGGSDNASNEPYKIRMTLKTNAAEFWNIIQAGAEAYEKEHPNEVKLSIYGPPGETYYEEQLNSIQTDLVADYDGYLIAPLQSEAVATAIASTDKPVVAYDTNIDSDKCLAFVGTGNKEAAKEGAKAAVEAAKANGWDEIKCIEIAGVQGDSTNTARMDGYREGITEAGGEFLDNETQYANATADLAVTAMEGIMSKYPDGVAIICSNNDDMALAAARTAKSNPNYAKTIFLGFDGQKSACEAVAAGELTMTAAQNNFDIGYKAVETMVKILNGEQYDKVVDTGTEIVTKDTAEERLAKFDEWMK